MQVDHRQPVEHVRLDEATEGDGDAEVGAGIEDVVDAVGHRQPELERRRLDRARRRRRRRGRAACRRAETTSATSKPASTSARSGGTDIAGVPR